MFDKSVPDREGRAEPPMCEALTERGRSGGDRRADHPHRDRPYTRLSQGPSALSALVGVEPYDVPFPMCSPSLDSAPEPSTL
jgi:hypothetical protein